MKANAYGHDSQWVVKTLRKSQIWGFGVAYDTEAKELASQIGHTNIIVLSAWNAVHIPQLIKNKTRLVVWDVASAHAVAAAARRLRRRAYVHIKIDTGTTRIGTRPEHLAALRNYIRRHHELIVEGVFSHYADSEAADLSFSQAQRKHFLSAARSFSAPLQHLACTAAALRLPLDHTNLVRLGIGLYGLWPSGPTKRSRLDLVLHPVLSWKTRLLQVKQVPRGTSIGYGRTYRTNKPTTIGILPVGYADGYDRKGSNMSSVVIHGTRCPVIGRISMNLLTVNLNEVHSARRHDEATLIGRGVTADDLARSWRTINYEVVTRIDRAIPRIEVP